MLRTVIGILIPSQHLDMDELLSISLKELYEDKQVYLETNTISRKETVEGHKLSVYSFIAENIRNFQAFNLHSLTIDVWVKGEF